MDERALFTIILALLLIGFIGHRGYYHRKLAVPLDSIIEDKERGAGSRVAGLIAIPALLTTLIFMINPAWLSWSSLPFPFWVRWLGVAVALLGFTLLQWSHQALGRNWSDEPRLIEGQELVTGGPYRRIRHPIYAAFLLILGSPTLISANWLLGGLWISMTAVDVVSRIRIEEDLMLSRFGDEYREYVRRTGRVLPRIGAPSEDGP